MLFGVSRLLVPVPVTSTYQVAPFPMVRCLYRRECHHEEIIGIEAVDPEYQEVEVPDGDECLDCEDTVAEVLWFATESGRDEALASNPELAEKIEAGRQRKFSDASAPLSDRAWAETVFAALGEGTRTKQVFSGFESKMLALKGAASVGVLDVKPTMEHCKLRNKAVEVFYFAGRFEGAQWEKELYHDDGSQWKRDLMRQGLFRGHAEMIYQQFKSSPKNIDMKVGSSEEFYKRTSMATKLSQGAAGRGHGALPIAAARPAPYQQPGPAPRQAPLLPPNFATRGPRAKNASRSRSPDNRDASRPDVPVFKATGPSSSRGAN